MSDITSFPTDVTVFPDRARVTRRGTLTLEAGIHQIAFNELPLALLPDSVRVQGRGTAAALLGVDTRRAYFTETPAANVQELERQIEALSDQDKALADQAAAADTLSAFARSLAESAAEQFARGLSLGRAQIAQGGDLVAFVQQQLTSAQTAARDIAQQRRALERQLEKLSREMDSLSSSRPRERYAAIVEVEVKEAGELTLDLTYLLGSASWQALYDMRALGTESESPGVQLTYLAQVTQNTGEDWDDVSMTLSTARPELLGTRPELDPWYLEVYAPPIAPQSMMRAMAAAPMPYDAVASTAAPSGGTMDFSTPMEEPAAEVNSDGASVTFKLAQQVSVPSDGTPHKVNVATLEWKPRLDYISVPKKAEVAYRRATVTNDSDYLLLPGQANLFVEGDFVGTMPLEQIAPNEEFEVMLGVDDRVVVKRELKARAVDKKFIIGDRRLLRVGYEIEVRNLRAVRTTLEVRDQIPVSRHERIKVKLESADPKPGEQTELHELKWQLSLAPNEKTLIRFDFSIEYPTSMHVVGLP